MAQLAHQQFYKKSMEIHLLLGSLHTCLHKHMGCIFKLEQINKQSTYSINIIIPKPAHYTHILHCQIMDDSNSNESGKWHEQELLSFTNSKVINLFQFKPIQSCLSSNTMAGSKLNIFLKVTVSVIV